MPERKAAAEDASEGGAVTSWVSLLFPGDILQSTCVGEQGPEWTRPCKDSR